MEAVEICLIDEGRKEDIRLPNQPFTVFGQLVPAYDGESWSYTTRLFPQAEEACFPDEPYDFDAMHPRSTFLGAYSGGECVGLAILQEGFFKYMYLYDLKVNASCRRQGVAGALLGKAREVARQKGYIGLYTQGQDNNLGACLFYLHQGFVIGGMDGKVYQGTPQEGKKDILFYWDF